MVTDAKSEVLGEYPDAYAVKGLVHRALGDMSVWLVCGTFAPDGVGWFVWGGTQAEAWEKVRAAIREHPR